MRIDREGHHGLPEDHLHYGVGKNSYADRSGNEAYDIIGDVLKNSNTQIIGGKKNWNNDWGDY